MNSKAEKIKGGINSTVGKMKQNAGKLMDDKTLEAKGLAQEGKGQGQQAAGALKETAQKGAKAVANVLEKVAKKIQSKS